MFINEIAAMHMRVVKIIDHFWDFTRFCENVIYF